MNKKELGIYVHIPFCVRKCYYCDFISYTNKEELVSDYINALIKELKERLINVKKENCLITTIYIGGGTPSYIDSKYIVNIIETIKEMCEITKETEITIEVNPGTVTNEKLEDYIKCGVNRISIGLQSANNQILKQIGRIHTYEQFLETYKLARKAGFKNINIDLMLALPNQTIDILNDSLNKVIKLNPEHISVYSLILEEGTVLNTLVENEKVVLPNEDIERKMYWMVKKELEKNGYEHYEISNFAKKGYISKHNFNCWNQEEYMGFGVAAHSYTKNMRYSNTENLQKYLKAFTENTNIVTIHEKQQNEDKQKEYMLLGLRKLEGIKISEFKNKFVQNPIYLYRKELEKLVKEELVEIEGDNIKLTNKGLDLANVVFSEFV